MMCWKKYIQKSINSRRKEYLTKQLPTTATKRYSGKKLNLKIILYLEELAKSPKNSEF